MIRGTGDWLNFLGCVRVQRGDVIFIGSIKCFKVIRPDEIALWSGFLCGKRSIAQVKPSPELVRVFLLNGPGPIWGLVLTGSGSIWSELKISCRSTSGAFPLALDSAGKKLQVRDYPGIFAEILDRFWTGPTELTDQTTANRKYHLTSTKIIFQYCYAAICETTVRVAEIVKQRLLSCSDDDDYQPNLVCAIGVIS